MLIAFFLSLSLNAPGDIEAVLATPVAELDVAQKQKLATAITGVFPKADTSTVTHFYCVRDIENKDASKRTDVLCDGKYKTRVSESKFVDLAIAGKTGQAFTGAPEGQVDFLRIAKRTRASAADKLLIKDFVESVFSGTAINLILDFVCTRAEDDNTKITCRCAYFDEVSPPTYVTLLHTGFVVRPIRRVP